MPLDDHLLRDYMNTFYGYGNYAGDWWLVRMEEGGGNSDEEVRTRLRLWDERGRKELEDVDMFASSPGLAKWFTPRPPLQSTWRGLIRLILSAEGRATDPATTRVHQGTELGRANSNNCILELMPLPSQSVGHWIYGQHSALPELQTRETYLQRIAPARVAHLRQRIKERKPKAIIFYSRKYQPWWEQIAGAPFGEPVEPGVRILHGQDTVFVMTLHPVYRGVKADYFTKSGVVIAEAIARGSKA